MAGREGPVRERAERYASLRAGSRAVTRLRSPNGAGEPGDGELGPAGRGELEGRLREAEHQAETTHRASGTLLDRIDSELDGLAAEILAQLRRIPVTRLPAAVASLRTSDPEGASALLDLCLESAAQGSAERGFLDAAIAFLRREGGDGPSLEAESPVSARKAGGGQAHGDSEALAAIAHEVLRRLAGTTPGDGAAAEIAATLDLAQLTDFERGILRRPDADPLAPALRSAVALRLIARRLSQLSPRLAALGLDPTRLRRELVPELGAKLRAATSALAARAEGDARGIADLCDGLLAAWGERRGEGAVHPERIRGTVRPPCEAAARRNERGLSGRAASQRRFRIAGALAIAAILAILVVAAVLR